MGDYPYSNLSVPQGTYPDLESASGYTSTAGSVPDLNAANDAAYLLAPPQEMGAFPNLSTQADFTNPVSGQYIGTSTWTYPTVPQNALDPWSMPGPCMFLSCICHFPLYSPRCESKALLRCESPAVLRWRRLATLIGGGRSPCSLLGGRDTGR
jgi:hypothetical protein